MWFVGWCVLVSSAYSGELAPGPDIVEMEQGYRVGAGDLLRIQVVGESDLSKVYAIQTGGYLEMPFVGRVAVSGLGVDEVSQRLEERYQGDWLVAPQITVDVSEYRAHMVLVAGEGVKKPAEYYLKGETSALEMLTRAGWVSTGTDSRDIELTRADGTVHRWDLAVLASSPDQDVQLRNGDRLMVHEGNQVYVAGEVKEPGGIAYMDGLTALQALSHAGGASDVGRLRGAYVLRGEVRIPINLKRVQRGRGADLVLEVGDQLYIPESAL